MPAAAPHPSVSSPFMKACRREPVPYTPVWLMRQAGRYMKEYRDLRARVSMLELCKSPALVSEVTTHAAARIGADAAILFADLLLIVEPLGLQLEYGSGEGPMIAPPVRDGAAADALREADPEELAYVYEAVRRTRADLPAHLPLIGFAGAPFTVASYLIEGGSTRRFEHTKRFMYADEGAWRALMEKIVRGTVAYLNRQAEAGAQALQVFDSWVGCLSPADYRRYVRPHAEQLFAELRPDVPVIHFATDTAALLPDMRAAGGGVIGLDWRVDLDEAWARVGHDVAVMGNLDPLVLFADPGTIRAQTRRILDQAAGRDGHVFNLGHGILPDTPVDHVIRLIEMVHEMGRR